MVLEPVSHSKAECPNPRVFKGPCRICDKEGHPAAECPERPPDVCKNCKMEGKSKSKNVHAVFLLLMKSII